MASELFQINFKAMGGSNEICAWCSDKNQFDHVVSLAVKEILAIEERYSRYRASSVISKINAAAGESWVEIPDELSSLLDYADTCWKESEGLFDITSGVFRRVWDFNAHMVPTDKAIAEAIELIGWEKVERSNGKIRLPKVGMQIDLGGIGKEFAVDRAARVLIDHGVNSALINLGGDIGAIGPKPNGEPWNIGIRHPRSLGDTVATLNLNTGALATSGDYERYFEVGGERYCHIINPKSGRPVQDLQSVSVAAPTCLVAGSLSTISMLLGKQRATSLLNNSGFPYLMIDRNGELLRP